MTNLNVKFTEDEFYKLNMANLERVPVRLQKLGERGGHPLHPDMQGA